MVLALLLTFSCKKEDKDPVLNTNQIQAPIFSSPANGGSYILLEDNKDQAFANFAWSVPTYNFTDLAQTKYTLEMDATDNNFASPIFIGTATGTEFSLTVGNLNNMLLGNNFTPDVAANLSFRVISKITENNTGESKISDPIALSITPYSSEVLHKPIYMLGDGTDPGWSNTDALPADYISEGKFGIVANLGGSGKFFKFISVLGQWAPQWGTDDAGTSTAGNLVYRPTEDITDPVAMPCPDVAGLYRIVADTANLSYEVFETSGNLYLLGDGSTAGWDNAAALQMTSSGNGVFTITTDLTAASIKFIEVLGQWAPQWGAVDGASGFKGNISFRPTEADPDPASIAVPSAGTYTIEVNLGAQTYKLTPQ